MFYRKENGPGHIISFKIACPPSKESEAQFD